jgi:hypothetical protein
VALVLKKASELEEVEGTGSGGGLTLNDLEQIASEVGISPDLVKKAVAELDARTLANPFERGQLVHQAIRAVDGELDDEAVAELVRHLDGSSDQVGVVTEALGSIQWTAQERFRTTQVSITPSKGETKVRVVDRAAARLRNLTHAAPTMTAVALVAGTIGQFDPSSLAVAFFCGIGGAVGALVGRVLWRRMSNETRERVNRLAAELTQEAEAAIQTPTIKELEAGATDVPEHD